MSLIKTQYNRRSFLKASTLTGGGMLLGFSWFASCKPEKVVEEIKTIPSEWFDINSFLKIAENGMVTIMSPNPEIGQNVKTSMPMIIAEELDIPWKDVLVEQAPLSTDFDRQVAGGSQSIRKGWESLRMAGATAKQMLINAAAQQWEVDPASCTAANGVITNSSGATKTYGELATIAGKMEVPTEVKLKDPSEFKIIGTDIRNVDMDQLITGKPLFGLDFKREGMQYAVVLRPPAFGNSLKSFDDSETRKISGVNDVIQFGDKIAVLANSTWAAIKGQKALKAEWKSSTLENSEEHHDKMKALLDRPTKEPKRKDGNVRKAFAEADKIIEKVYEAPFLPHNCLEPMNFFADVTDTKAELIGPIQTPKWAQSRAAKIIGREPEEVTVALTRMGGGFGRRLYGDFSDEAAEISQLAKTPVKLMFTREDDMTAGTYRPASKYKFRASIKDGKMTGYHLVGVGINMQNATRENFFPAGVFENYLVESHNVESNITTGAWRAPITNFLAYAEQSFFDEVAQEIGVDAVQLRLDLIARGKANPIGEKDYDFDKLAGVIELARDKSGWGKKGSGVYQGFSAYYSHNTYVAEVADVEMVDNVPTVKKITCAIDCGIVVNPIAAKNQVEGGVIDGIGHAMYGDFIFKDGVPQAKNFNEYRLIRMAEAPEIVIHFVKSTNDPTGLGEPSLPPAGGAIANAFHAATGKRLYRQPFVSQESILG